MEKNVVVIKQSKYTDLSTFNSLSRACINAETAAIKLLDPDMLYHIEKLKAYAEKGREQVKLSLKQDPDWQSAEKKPAKLRRIS